MINYSYFINLTHSPDHPAPKACPPAEAFIGYGGVSVRDAVREGADWYVFSLYSLLDVLSDKPNI